jgi:hypothetical protein
LEGNHLAKPNLTLIINCNLGYKRALTKKRIKREKETKERETETKQRETETKERETETK